ncbi:MAG: zf-HC2 domain-containing protein [Planctomycetes bacterium]|nr:zf-HC2 domain-containing protein [Planctomycetota bacterium]MCB9918954.1 zf-HC2 domain-containing protein [Planctomycetota bacterium]
MSPARSRECRKCDSLLVAYCDRELEGRLRDWVDEHVVACKRCGIELSCIELETLRLREALVPMEPPVDFTDAVMDRVRDALAHESVVEPPRSVRGRGFTSRVLDQVREDLGEAPPVRNHRARRIAVALAAAVVLVAFSLPYFLSKKVEAPVTPRGWVVVEASNAGGLHAGDAVSLPYSGELNRGHIVLSSGEPAGVAGAGLEPAGGWRIGLEGRGRFTIISRDHIALEDGELLASSEATTAERLAVDLPGGHALGLQPGRYEVVVEGVEGRSIGLAMPGLDRITVRVYEGAAGLRTGGVDVAVASGSLAMLEPLRPVAIHPLASSEAFARLSEPEVRGGPENLASRRDDVVVRGIVRARGEAVPGARVAIHSGEREVTAVSGDDGSYELRIAMADARSSETASNDLWLSALAPSGRGDLAAMPFRSFRDRPAPGETVYEEVRLASVGERRGRLIGADGAALVGAHVRALRIDGFVGTARMLDGVEAISDENGAFVMDRLPPESAGESTAYVVEPASVSMPLHVEYGIDETAESNQLLIRVSDGDPVELPVQNPATRVVWILKRPQGVAADLVARVERIDLPAAGRSTVQVRLLTGTTLHWWEDEGTGAPRSAHEGEPRATGKGAVALLAAPPRAWAGGNALAASAAKVDSSQHALRVDTGLVASVFGRDAPRPSSSRGERGKSAELDLRVVGGTELVVPVEAARIYVRVGGGAAWFAGWTDLDGRILVSDLPRGAAVQVLAVSGTQDLFVGGGRYVVDEAKSAHRVGLAATRSIAAHVPPVFGSRLARLTILDGAFEGFEASARIGDEGVLRSSELPPGRLRIEVDGRAVVVGADGVLPGADAWDAASSGSGR